MYIIPRINFLPPFTMNFFSDSNNIKSKKVVIIPPLYNNDTTVEFLIQPEKNLFYPNEVFLHFSVKIPAGYVLDNQSADKLFDSVEVQLNSTKITNRSSSSEYFLSAYFNTRCSYPTDLYDTSMRPMGYYSTRSVDAADITALTSSVKAATLAEYTHYEVKESNVTTERVYNFITPIMSPLFQQTKPLPSNINVGLSFKRSSSNLPLLEIVTDSKNTFANTNVELKNVFLECTYVDDEILEKKYNYLNSKELKYSLEEPIIRTFTIESGLNEATFNVNTGGQLPFALFSTIITPKAFFGDKKLSPTKFERKNLTAFEVLVDNVVLPGSHVNITDQSYVEPYVSFLRNTKLYNNAMAGKTLRMSDFLHSNFILSYDLTTTKQETGWLSLKYNFGDYLSENLMVIVCLLYEKQLVINKDREIIVNN